MGRRGWLLLHRWAGLFLAAFLVVSGLTGSVLAFSRELRAWLDPPPPAPPAAGRIPLDPLVLRQRALSLEPAAEVGSVPLHLEPGEAFHVWYDARAGDGGADPTPIRAPLAWLDPFTGQLLERREAVESLWPVTRRNAVDLLVTLHYSLGAGEVGQWAFGLAALVWTLDCFVGLILTLPVRRRATGAPGPPARPWPLRWRTAWLVKASAGRWRLWFDLHRAAGLWTWLLLLALAWSGVAFTLHGQVYTPVMRAAFGWVNPYVAAPPLPAPRAPALSWPEARAAGRRVAEGELARLGARAWREDGLRHEPSRGVFIYTVRSDLDVSGRGAGTAVFLDDVTGERRALLLPRGQGPGAAIQVWSFALHTAGLFGLPGQVAVAAMGLVVTMLSVTGVWLWWKKRSLRAPARPRPHPP